MEEDTIRLPAHLRECQCGGMPPAAEEGAGQGEGVILFIYFHGREVGEALGFRLSSKLLLV